MIGSATVSSNNVYVRDEKGVLLSTISLGSRDTLLGYTGNTVTIQRSTGVHVYGPRGGAAISVVPSYPSSNTTSPAKAPVESQEHKTDYSPEVGGSGYGSSEVGGYGGSSGFSGGGSSDNEFVELMGVWAGGGLPLGYLSYCIINLLGDAEVEKRRVIIIVISSLVGCILSHIFYKYEGCRWPWNVLHRLAQNLVATVVFTVGFAIIAPVTVAVSFIAFRLLDEGDYSVFYRWLEVHGMKPSWSLLLTVCTYLLYIGWAWSLFWAVSGLVNLHPVRLTVWVWKKLWETIVRISKWTWQVLVEKVRNHQRKQKP